MRRTLRLPTRLRAASAASLAVTWMLLAALPAATAPIPSGSAWIDQPLTGSTLPLAGASFTVHATDPAGVKSVYLWVGHEVLGSAVIDQPGPILVTETFDWTPPGPGEYQLTVRGVGVTGEWSAPAIAIVTIEAADGGSPTPAPSDAAQPSASATAPPPTASPRPTQRPTPGATQLPTPRPTPNPTPRPTPPPCSPAPPDLIAPSNGIALRDPSLNPPTLRWGHRTPPACTPTGYRVQVFDDPDLAHVIADVTLGAVTEWTPPAALPDCTTYYWRVATRAPGGTFGAWSSPWSFELFVGRCV